MNASSANSPPPRRLAAALGRAGVSALVIYLIAILVFALFHGGLHGGYVAFLARENLPIGLIILVLLLVRNVFFRRR